MTYRNGARILLVMCGLYFPQYAVADHTYHWKVVAIDYKTAAPVQGAQFQFTFFDKKQNDKKSQDQCITDTAGNCDVRATVSGGFWAGSSLNYELLVNKEGYSSAFTYDVKKLEDQEFILTAKLLSLARVGGNASPLTNWALNEGPAITSHILLQPKSITELFKAGVLNSSVRGKFETEEAYQARLAIANKVLLVAPAPINNGKRCPTSYDHKAGIYLIRGCLIFSDDAPVATSTELGQPITLSNAYDSREVKRILNNKYTLTNSPGFAWTAEYKIGVKEAEALDSDLMIAVEVEDVRLSSSCSICEIRKKADSIDNISSSLAAITGKTTYNSEGWKNDAFKSGSLEEDWDHVMTPKKIIRYFVYRKSDQRLLFEMQVE